MACLPGDDHPEDATEDVPSSPRLPGYVTRSGTQCTMDI